MSKLSRLGNALYEGDVSIDFVSKRRRRIWYSISLLIVLLASAGLFVRGLNLGIEFEGGAEYRVTLPTDQVNQDTADRLREVVGALGIKDAEQPVVTTSGNEAVLVQTETLTTAESQQVSDAILAETGATQGDLSQSNIGASWGRDILQRALIGLLVFLTLVVLFIWAYFREWKMSVAAIVALIARRPHHHRHLCPVRVRGVPGDGHRHPDHPRLLAVRHGGGLRQGPREHQGPARQAHDVRQGGEPGGQPDPGPLDQHLDRGAAADRAPSCTSAWCSWAPAR